MARSLLVDFAARETSLDGSLIALTRIEFDLLACLVASPRVVITTQVIQREVWGSDWWGEDHQVEVHISRLRRKLGESGDHPHFIRTVRGVGYRFEPDPSETEDEAQREAIDGLAYIIVTVDGTIAWASASVQTYLGWSPGELVGRSLDTLTDTPQFIDWNVRTGVAMGASLRNRNGRLVDCVMIVRPIKTHAVVQSFLVELVGRGAIADDSPSAIQPIITATHRRSVALMYDGNLILTSISPRDELFLGWNPDDIVGTFFLVTNVPELLEDQARACALGQAIVDSGMRTVHDRMLARSASGELVPVHVHGEFLVDENGRVAGLHADVTVEG